MRPCRTVSMIRYQLTVLQPEKIQIENKLKNDSAPKNREVAKRKVRNLVYGKTLLEETFSIYCNNAKHCFRLFKMALLLSLFFTKNRLEALFYHFSPENF